MFFFACNFGINTCHISVCKLCKKNIYIIEPHRNMVYFFVFLSKAVSKCRCFSLAQCFLWWWGKRAENTEHCTVIGSAFCHSWGHNITTKSQGRDRKCKPLLYCHRVTLEVPIQRGHWPQIKLRQITLYLQ